jgi:hypothetical protein
MPGRPGAHDSAAARSETAQSNGLQAVARRAEGVDIGSIDMGMKRASRTVSGATVP